jgi:hypothetical protein
MGGGSFDRGVYESERSSRVATKTDDFAYSKQGRQTGQLHPDLDPRRINSKKLKKLESCDSEEHPESNAILVTFDVTGSNINRAFEVQKKLPDLMDLLKKYIKDPQISIAANDDFKVEPEMSTQISEFESDNRIDRHLRNIVLVSDGGGNSGESYDLLLYAAARKTKLDCWLKRKKKGYMFMYADEPLFEKVSKSEVSAVFGDKLQASIPIEDIIEEVRETYNLYLLSTVTPEYNAAKQYPKLFGQENVFTLQNPSQICYLIANIIGTKEASLSDDQGKNDLVTAGASVRDADAIIAAVRRKIRPDLPATA